MARGWRVLDATTFEGVVGGGRGRLTFAAPGKQEDSVPAEDVAVILLGQRVSLDSAALHYAAKHDVALLFADWRGVPFGGLYPWSDHSRVGARHLAQAQLSLPRRKNAWGQIIRAKVTGQANVLAEVDPQGARQLRQLVNQVRSGDPGNTEGVAARFYWSRLFQSVRRFTRDQDGEDPLNGMLNYGYTVLRGFGIRAVLGAGLSPSIGIFHRGRSNFFNLVDDLIEPFRPAIDSVVVGLGSCCSLEDAETKRSVVAAATQQFCDDGTRIPAVLDDLAQQFGRYAEGDRSQLAVLAWPGVPRAVRVVDDGEE
jgi:CRISP-associated protein Cas1